MREIVQDDDHRPPFVVPVAYHCRQIPDAGGIDRTVGLVEQHQWRILQHDPGKEGALQLATGEGANRTCFQAVQADPVDRLGDAPASAAVEAAKGADLAPQAHGDKVMNHDREAVVERRLLGEVGDLPSLDADQLDPALQRPEFAGDGLEQG
jgi:hypothetical protein